MRGVALTWQALREYDPEPYRAGGQERYLCPFCGDGKPRDRGHRCFAVDPRTGAFFCHRCGARGKLRDADTPTHRRERRTVHRWTPPKPPEPTETLHSATGWRYVPLRGTEGEAYLLGRGIPTDVAHSAGVRYCPSFRDAPAVVFPFRTDGGALVAVQGRYVGAHEPKARTYGTVTAGVFAAGAGAWDADTVGIAEAPIDALSLHFAGVPCFALGGTALRGWLPPLLAGRMVLVAFDADSAGDSASEAWAQELRRFAVYPVRLRPPCCKDWNEELCTHGRDWVARCVTGALAGVEPRGAPAGGVTCPQCGAVMEFFQTLADFVCARCFARYAGGVQSSQEAHSAPAGAGYGQCNRCGGVLDVARDGTLYCTQCRWKA